MTGFVGFSPRAFTFLRDLARNNSRAWFEARRDAYEDEIRMPLRAFVDEMDARLATFAPELVGDARRSLFRIHRDVRFSTDKSPYHTHAACWFYHRDVARSRAGGAAHGGAGLYFQLGPAGCFLAGGLWMPPPAMLSRVRERIAEDPEAFERTMSSAPFRRVFGHLSREAVLTRTPRGYPANHRAAAWLTFRSFTASAPVARRDVTTHTLPDLVGAHYVYLVPLVRWLNEALGYRTATRR